MPRVGEGQFEGEGTLRDAVRGVVLGRVGVSRGSCGRADADKWRDSPLSLESMRGVICERYFLSHWSAVFSKRLYSVALLPTRALASPLSVS